MKITKPPNGPEFLYCNHTHPHSSVLLSAVSSYSQLNWLDQGCLPFSQKIRKFRIKVKWKGNFPENPFGNCGLPPEVVLFFRSERNVGNFLTICFNFLFPGPFKDLSVILVVVQYGSLMVSAISSGWSAYSESPLPLCNGHTNRIFLTNGKHPKYSGSA